MSESESPSFLDLAPENLEREHICCAITGAQHQEGVDRKKAFLAAGRSPYLTDTRFYLHHDFELVEQTDTGFDLVCFRADSNAPRPRFGDNARRGRVPEDAGVHFEYVYQCPFVPGCLTGMSGVALDLGLPVSRRELATVEAAHGAASPFGTFGAFLYGRLITHELMSERKFARLLEKELQESPRS